MKKIILSIAVLGVCAFTATTTHAQMVSASSASVAPAQTADAKLPELPKFKSEAANKGVVELTTIFKEYAPAIKAKDTAKIMEFATKMQGFQQSATWISELSADEQQQFQTYMKALGDALIGNPEESEQPAGSAPTE